MSDGLTPAGLDRLRATARPHVADDDVPGMVVLVAHGAQVHAEALGTLAVGGGGGSMARDSLFRIASVTKPVTGAATLALIEEGLLGLDEPVDELLPELADPRVLRRVDGDLDDTVPASRPITTRDLLTFTFGFGIAMEMFTRPGRLPVAEAAAEAGLAAFGPSAPDTQPDPGTWMARLGALPLLAQPGERWLYNTAACVLGVLLARAAGQPFGEVLRTRIFEPLGMEDTGFGTSHPERLATAYRSAPAGGLELRDPPDGQFSRPPAFPDGAAGLVSTADDLLAFARMLLRGGSPVLSAESVRAMTTDQLTPAQKARGGLGPGFFAGQSWSYCQAVQASGAFGWNGGSGCSWLVDPGADLVVVALTQREFETPDGPPLHREIQAAAYAALA
ncbi:MAG TPA: serine hydrolase domain-containing protein [Streptosporangiaceae bacterium]|jgi:CubicO group peptidase (beta-lactamase class C family)